MFYFGFGFHADFILWMIVGAVVGYLAAEMRRGTPAGCLTSLAVGAFGGLAGGFLYGLIPGLGFGLGQCGGLIFAPALGALIALALLGVTGGNQRIGGGFGTK
jgi:uncharacterized membrane protein YeaQ/YmgE (transglycosylase-associated protein family)